MSDYIEVDFYVMGVYQGKRKIGKNSICGALLSSDLLGAANHITAMVDELNQIPDVTANSSLTITAPDGLTAEEIERYQCQYRELQAKIVAENARR